VNYAVVVVGVVVAIAVYLSLAGLPDNSQKARSDVLEDTSNTRLATELRAQTEAHPGMDGVLELPHGRDAFAARGALAREADRTIDTQYYMWHQDTVGRLLIHELLAAADRGVRVRMLIDDMYGSDGQDTWRAIDAHPNVEVRLFAPYSRRQFKYLQFLTRFKDVNARMHTKTFTVDNQATVVGGRNIGDEYFDADPKLAFADNDVMLVGPVVGAVSAEFNDYWNSDYAYPVSLLLKPGSEDDLRKFRDQADDFFAKSATSTYVKAVDEGPLAVGVREGTVSLEWARATIVHDSWRKRDRSYPGWEEDLLITQLRPHIEAATDEVIMISPYFVPGKEDDAMLCKLAKKGVSVKILTNSLASNDVAAVHAGYSKHREKLLRCGVELYELDELLRTAQRRAFFWLPDLGKSSLHAKTMIFDRKKMFVGSFNYDQRSLYLNTEIGVVFEQPEVAETAATAFNDGVDRTAFRLELVTDADGNDSLRWHGIKDGAPVTYDTEPYVGRGTRATVAVLRLFPIDWLL
jgi:putative cardiolipin synthase